MVRICPHRHWSIGMSTSSRPESYVLVVVERMTFLSSADLAGEPVRKAARSRARSQTIERFRIFMIPSMFRRE